MKHLKAFENKKQKYNLNDYVFLDMKKLKENGMSNNLIDSPFAMIDYVHDDTMLYPYIVTTNRNKKIAINTNEIIRLMTPEEIEQYKLDNNIFKYNL